jgi:serine/threonine protein kinase
MDQDRWKRVNQIFHAALEVSSNDRARFVLTASNGDTDLQAEVELLLNADQNAGSYLESPLVDGESPSSSNSPVSPGDVLCGRFRILRAIGEGGMGHVFEALDNELAVHVALKVIRPEIASSPEVLARFRQEVRLARQITHPNVCRTFDLERDTRIIDSARGTKQEIVFLTMEFLEGETLATKVKRDGPISLDEALEISRQIADALHAAHLLGIIHRDMKPANVVLVPTGSPIPLGIRAVVTDFGLARLDPVLSGGHLSALGHTSRPIGTIAYMAPEQLENVQVSPVTDIYAFGLILFEMITGTRAFPSESFLSGIAQRLTGSAPPPQAIVPSLPQSWCRAIEGCLRLRPADRLQSASDVIAILDGRRSAPLRAKRLLPVPWMPVARLSVAFRFILSSGILITAVALFFAGYRLYRSSEDSKVNSGALVYLPAVRNQTGDKELDDLTPLLQASLSQSARITLLDQGRIGDTLQMMTKGPDSAIDEATAREIAMRTGAVRVIFGTISGGHGSYRLDIDIQQPDSTPNRYRDHWPKSFYWQTSGSTSQSAAIPAELLHTVRSTGDWIRNKVGESANDIARLDTPPEDVTTGNWTALTDYANAELFVVKREPEKAVLALEDATEVDPAFALAYARLGDLLFSLNRAAEGYEAYNRALSADLAHKLTRKERDFIKGAYAVDTWDFAAADLAFRDYAAYYENDYAGVFFRAYPLRMLGRLKEAVDVLKRAQELAPSNSGTYVGLGYDYMLEGDLEDAHHCAADLRRLGFPDEASLLNGHLDFLNHNYQQSVQDFEAMKTSQTSAHRSLSYSLVARVEAEQDHIQEALETLRSGIEYDHSIVRHPDEAAKYADMAYLECRRGDVATCIEDTDRAANLDRRPETILRSSSTLGNALVQSRNLAAADLHAALMRLKQNLGSVDYGPVYDLARLRVNGELKLVEGDPASALREFRKADIIDSPITDRQYLARGLMAVAAAEPNPVARKKLQLEALAAYGRSVDNPSIIWYYSPHYPPGFLADQIQDSLKLAISMGDKGETVQRLQTDLKSLRGNHPAIP